MLLSARILNGVASVNAFDYADAAEFTQGDAVDVYFQLVDASKDKALYQFKPGGRRYVPAPGATLTVRLDNLDDNVAVSRAATQPFPTSDPSIWKVSVLASDGALRGTCALALTLNESGKLTYGRVEGALRIADGGTL